ncbi:MAG: PSD1 and planctomycete cytochrome C domain-containing protein [Gemmataceae bacterium]
MLRRSLVFPPLKLAMFLIGTVMATPTAWAGETNPEGVEFFEKTIRPLLAANCLSCHNAAKHKGGLVLETEAGLIKGGDSGPAVKPGDAEKSLLIELIRYNGDIKMPPKSKLPDKAIAELTKWVKIGAPWPADHGTGAGDNAIKPFNLKERSRHWSLQPLKTVPAPSAKRADWPRDDLDRFILAKLECNGLKQARPAEKRTWLRRVTFDLIGLPPTPQEIKDFLADDSGQAYEKVVDRLLASPHYGERWARHWLDLVRYGESAGHEFDFEMPEAFEYRDYVIRALNDDVAYDRFIIENIAGDLLPKPRRHPKEHFNESIIGTGFWFLGESVHSPVEVRQDMADRIDNQIDVFGKTFLGMTLACARCHDHKFDAVPTKDYYSLMGCLESSRYQRAFIDDPKPTKDLISRLHEVRRELDPMAIAVTARSLKSQVQKAGDPAKADPAIRPLLELVAADDNHFAAKKTEMLERWKAEKERAAKFESQATSFESFAKPGYKNWFITGEAFGEKPAHFGQIDLRPDDSMPVRRVCREGLVHSGLVSGRLQGALRSQTFRIEKSHILYHLAGQAVRVNLIIDGFQRIQEPIYGGLTFYAQNDRPYWAVQNVSMWKGHNAYIEFLGDGDGYVAVDRILLSDKGITADAPNPLLMRLLEDPSTDTRIKLKEALQNLFLEIIDQWQSGKLAALEDCNERIGLLNALLSSGWDKGTADPSNDQEDRDHFASIINRWQELEKQLPTPRRVMAMTDGTGIDERIFIRGNYKNLGEEAPRRFLEVFAGADQSRPESGSGRLELARRLVNRAKPLLARVMVNRLWKHHFSEGIVRTPDDFGAQGQEPTHPELLDYLATEFIRHGWSIKKMHRMMVLSSTYRMASQGSAKEQEADPQNKLLHRMPIQRLEAECMRDAILAVSGRLDKKLYGPSVTPYLTEFMIGRGRPASGPLDGDGRRSIYIKVRRNFLTPMFLAFDFPIPFTTMGRRSVSNVPAQALALMNNPFVIQQASVWAKRVLSEKDLTPTQRIKSMYLSAFGREPSEAEIGDALEFLADQAKEYGNDQDPRAWTDFCHVMMNAKEFIFIN